MEDPRIDNQDIETGTKKKITAAEVDEAKKHLATKSVMLLVAAVIVVVVLAVLGIAWYTRVANTYSVTFSVADYDLAVNNNRDELFKLNVYEYSQVTNKYMAPGTIGWMPLDISAQYSQVDVSFSISLVNHMPPEIAKHFRFFVLMDSKEDPETHEVTYVYHYGDALTNASAIDSYKKYYLDSDSIAVIDTITKSTEKMLCIYWEWYVDAYRADEDHTETDEEGHKTFTFYLEDGSLKTRENMTGTEWSGTITRWDNLDTDIGRYPAKYKDSLVVSVHATGAQIEPSDGVYTETTTTTTAAE